MHGTTAPQTADPNASQATQNVLTYLQNIGRRSTHRVIVGQLFQWRNCCSGSYLPAAGWAANIAALYTATGYYPGLVGGDFNDENVNAPGTGVNYAPLNSYLISAWNAGSLIHVGYSATNPWTGNGRNDNSCGGGTMADLVNPATSVYTAWHTQLARVAAGLQALQAAGVVVIFRPLPEQNNGSWWTACNTVNPQATWSAVWADMFTTLTSTYGLHNLLWAAVGTTPMSRYSIAACAGLPQNSICFYPGSAYVDLLGADDYLDATGPMPENFVDDWTIFNRMGKPVEYLERGPAETDGTSNVYTTIIAGILANRGASRPVVGYFMSWFYGWSIVANPGAVALMSDPNAATQADVGRALSCMSAASNYAARVACVLTP